MSIEDIDHLYVETRYFEKSLAFWSALGFGAQAQWGEGGHRACRLQTSGGEKVVLAEALAEPVPPTVHLRMSDCESLNTRLVASEAVKVSTPLEATHWGTQWIRVTDPDGRCYALEESP